MVLPVLLEVEVQREAGARTVMMVLLPPSRDLSVTSVAVVVAVASVVVVVAARLASRVVADSPVPSSCL